MLIWTEANALTLWITTNRHSKTFRSWSFCTPMTPMFIYMQGTCSWPQVRIQMPARLTSMRTRYRRLILRFSIGRDAMLHSHSWTERIRIWRRLLRVRMNSWYCLTWSALRCLIRLLLLNRQKRRKVIRMTGHSSSRRMRWGSQAIMMSC